MGFALSALVTNRPLDAQTREPLGFSACYAPGTPWSRVTDRASVPMRHRTDLQASLAKAMTTDPGWGVCLFRSPVSAGLGVMFGTFEMIRGMNYRKGDNYLPLYRVYFMILATDVTSSVDFSSPGSNPTNTRYSVETAMAGSTIALTDLRHFHL